ncbi:MAG: hypothetical protein ACRC2T_07530 [Thermoguttaceae bacterium]
MQRFLDSINSSTEKSVRQILKSSDVKGAWNYWAELLKNRAAELDIKEYAKLLSNTGFTNEMLDEACKLVLSTKSYSPSEWLDSLDSLIKYCLTFELNENEEANQNKLPFEPLKEQNRGELAYFLGSVLSELKSAKQLIETGKAIFAKGLDELVDGAGLPSAQNYLLVRPLLFCWTRVLFLGRKTGNLPWKNKAQQQYEWVVLHTLRFTRKDGSQVLGRPFSSYSLSLGAEFKEAKNTTDSVKAKETFLNHKSFRDALEVALSFDSDELDRRVAQVVLPNRKGFTKSKNSDNKSLPEASYFSDWSGIGVLRSGWSHEEPAVTVLYGKSPFAQYDPNNIYYESSDAKKSCTDSNVLCEFSCKSQPIISGNWVTTVWKGGKKLESSGTWNANCEICEPTHDYYELETMLSDGSKLQRHFLLVHDDEFLILADSVIPQRLDNEQSDGSGVKKNESKSGKIELEIRLPLSESVRIQTGEPQGTERIIFSTTYSKEGPISRILPLGLPEWETAESSGELLVETVSNSGNGKNTLIFKQFGNGDAIFAPLFFDLKGTRLKHPYTWRQLTIGEKLQNVTSDKAAGFRVQVGKDQFLLYRSLAAAANRTVLGHNLVSDMFLGRFTKDVGVESIVEIEEE